MREWVIKITIGVSSLLLCIYVAVFISYGQVFDEREMLEMYIDSWIHGNTKAGHTIIMIVTAFLFIAFLIFFNLLLWLPRLQRAIFRVPSGEEIAERKRLKQERKRERLQERLDKLK